MVRLLILVMAGAVALALAYFFFKTIPMAKKMLAVGGGLLAALAAVSLQGNYPFYMPLLAMLGIALLVSLIYMKALEKHQLEKRQQQEKRKAGRSAALQKKSRNAEAEKPFTMAPAESGKGE